MENFNIWQPYEYPEVIRTCKKCGDELPATQDYFYKDKHRLRWTCRKCTDAYYKKKYYEDNGVKQMIANKKWVSLNRDKVNLYQGKLVSELSDSYVVRCLKMNREVVTEEIINVKREIIKIKRLIKLKSK